jgi:precorrin-3B C17-methyltransferase
MNKLYILSSGAGGIRFMTMEALEALEECEVVVSYTKYAKELQKLIQNKIIYTSGMTQEIQRANKALEYAKNGQTTCIISNGDVNVFGMATLIVELIDQQDLWDKIEVISIAGVTSFLAAASKAGAPISQDFAIISLSDRLTDINLINKRVKMALECDMILGIYNPKSKSRTKPYLNFLNILEQYNNKIVIIASNVGRKKEKIIITNTQDLIYQNINHPDITMATLIIICNNTTRLTKNNLALTPRGYLDKYTIQGDIK